MAQKRQVVCWGGGMGAENALLDLYLLAQTGKKEPKVCFIPTASGDNIDVIKAFFAQFKRYPCKLSYLSFFNPSVADVEDFTLSQDLLVVGGGHSKSMLSVWRGEGFDGILRKAYEGGVALSGGSAGSVCWFDECITDSVPGDLTVMSCLGLLPYSNCPHYTSEDRQMKYAEKIAKRQIKPGYANDECAALHFVDEKLFRSVSIVPSHKTFFVSVDNDEAKEEELETLDLQEHQDDLIWSSPTFDFEE